MKKYLIMLAAIVTVAAGCYTLTSCGHDDDEISYTLDGYWEGKVSNWYDGTTYVDWEFIANGDIWSTGYGYEWDYDSDWYSVSTTKRRFDYIVNNGVITITYHDGSGQQAQIRHYRLTNRTFSGELRLYRGGYWQDWFDFSFVKTSESIIISRSQMMSKSNAAKADSISTEKK